MQAKSVMRSVLALVVLTIAMVSKAANEEFVVFGDSLSDPGNYFHIFGEQEVQPYELPGVPGAPYAVGGHHFSNGETWIEQLTRRLGTQESGSPATVAPGVFSNYAIGRSRARNVLLDGVFDKEGLTSQVNRFLDDHPDGIPSDATYVVWVGSNDTADAIGALLLQADPTIAQSIVLSAVGNIVAELKRLYLMGARNFVIPNIPDFSYTPVIRQLAAGAGSGDPVLEHYVLGLVSQVSGGFNGALSFAAGQLSALPGISIQPVNVSGFLAGVVADPQSYGLENATEACTTPGAVEQVFCQSPAQYLFWDGQHPTKAGHRLLAELFADELAL